MTDVGQQLEVDKGKMKQSEEHATAGRHSAVDSEACLPCPAQSKFPLLEVWADEVTRGCSPCVCGRGHLGVLTAPNANVAQSSANRRSL
jgi:hypothetical protein